MFRQKGFVVPTDVFLKVKFFVNTTLCRLLFSSRRFEITYFLFSGLSQFSWTTQAKKDCLVAEE